MRWIGDQIGAVAEFVLDFICCRKKPYAIEIFL